MWWSWRRWRRARQLRRQQHQQQQQQQAAASGAMAGAPTHNSSSSHVRDAAGGTSPAPPALALLVDVGRRLDRRAPITLGVVGAYRAALLYALCFMLYAKLMYALLCNWYSGAGGLARRDQADRARELLVRAQLELLTSGGDTLADKLTTRCRLARVFDSGSPLLLPSASAFLHEVCVPAARGENGSGGV